MYESTPPGPDGKENVTENALNFAIFQALRYLLILSNANEFSWRWIFGDRNQVWYKEKEKFPVVR